MIKVLHISLDDRPFGIGANARLLHKGTAFYGVESSLCVKYTIAGEDSYRVFKANSLQEIVANYVFKECNVVHLHMCQGYFLTQDLYLLREKAIIWSITDSSAYTADCSLGAHCKTWQNGCSDCFIADNLQEKESKVKYLAEKIKKYKDLDITFICANQWQYNQLKTSVFKDKKAELIPILKDTSSFYPGTRKQARESLGLPLASFIVIYHNELGSNAQKITSYFEKVLNRFKDDINEVLVVNIGSKINMESAPGYSVRNIHINDAGILGEYYRAANLNIYLSPMDSLYRPVAEAALCGVASVIFDVGSANEVIENEKTGIIINQFDKDALYVSIGRSMANPEYALNLGVAAYHKYKDEIESNKEIISKYIALYQSVLKLEAEEKVFDMIPRAVNYKKVVNAEVKQIFSQGWNEVEAFVKKKLAGELSTRSQGERYAYVDLFCKECLAYVDWQKGREMIWQLMVLWYRCRDLKDNISFENKEHQMVHLDWVKSLRSSLVEYFTHVSLPDFTRACDKYVNEIVAVWRFIFLNVQSPLHLDAEKFVCPKEFFQYENGTGYPFVMLKSMFVPYMDDNSRVDIAALMKARLSITMKICMLFWLTSAPLYNGTVFNRKIVLENIAAISDYMVQSNDEKELSLSRNLVSHFVVSLWRISYLGGNNIYYLEKFGEFVAYVAGKLAPQFTKAIPRRKRKKTDKIRVGYISMNFRNQAVSQYMVNRLIYANRKKFYIKTFILKHHSDEMTEKIKGYSDESVEFTDFAQIAEIATVIRNSDLDILVYTDIGMEMVTYILASLKLAPVQAVLVGHGTTTGLSTLDYYISGDHEPNDADSHYIESLIKLPVLGAAQLPPQKTDKIFKRSQLGIPEDSVIFISCANGLKHYPDRDGIFIEILRRVPNGYIVLKPFQSPGTVDKKFSQRVLEKAKAAGVADRLKILDPLPKPGDLMGLIVMADIQLDTYPYGGWTTNLEAIYYGLPIVTQEGKMARNRWGAGMLRAMDIEAGIAHTEDEYIMWAEKLAKDVELRKAISEKINKTAKRVLFNGIEAQKNYEDMLVEISHVKK